MGVVAPQVGPIDPQSTRIRPSSFGRYHQWFSQPSYRITSDYPENNYKRMRLKLSMCSDTACHEKPAFQFSNHAPSRARGLAQLVQTAQATDACTSWSVVRNPDVGPRWRVKPVPNARRKDQASIWILTWGPLRVSLNVNRPKKCGKGVFTCCCSIPMRCVLFIKILPLLLVS